MTKDKVVKFRVTEEEYSNLVLKAGKYNSVSNYIRDLLEKDTKSDYDGIVFYSCSRTDLGVYVLEFGIEETEEVYNYVVTGVNSLKELSKFFNLSISDLVCALDYESKHMEIFQYPITNSIHSLEDLKK